MLIKVVSILGPCESQIQFTMLATVKVKHSLLNFGLFFIMFGWMEMREGGKNILKIRDSLRR